MLPGTFPLQPFRSPPSARRIPNLASSSVLEYPAAPRFLWNVRPAPGCQLFSETISLFRFRFELWCLAGLLGDWQDVSSIEIQA